MKHYELLERVNKIKIVSCDENIDFEHVHSLNEPKSCNQCLTCMGLSALRAVVELHKPVFAIANGIEGPKYCQQCADGRVYATYPCPTIKAIEKELQ